MLHEGLGSVAHWRDFPMRLAAETGAGVFVYSRYGHGDSDALDAPREITYMHEEAETVLPDVLRQAGIDRPILFGHSDGASIAILYAGRFPDSVSALILEAPHVFVEQVSVESIVQAKVAYETTDLRVRLGRYHAHVDAMFRGWNDIWLDPAFRAWNIESSLDTIRCPLLVIQGEDDEYGTLRQIEAIRARVPSVEFAILADCRHAPHRDQPDATLRRIAAFLGARAS
jgi:pimeloyl-ACP methyl ester carboxylesterase